MHNLCSLEGRVALVTGAGNGIGQAIAIGLAEQGAFVFLADIRTEGCKATASHIESISGRARVAPLDVRNDDAIRSLIREIVSQNGRLDILVNSAGLIPHDPVELITADDWDQVMAVNARGTLFASRAAMAPMREGGGGVIINIASGAGKKGSVLAGFHYAASKAAVISLTMSFARKLAPDNIRVVALAPGPVLTGANSHIDPAAKERLRESVALKRIARAEEIASAAVFLASDAASYITGEILDVDGGATFD